MRTFPPNLILLLIALLLGGCKAIRYNIPNADDYKLFSERVIHAGENPRQFCECDSQPLEPIRNWAMGKHFHKGDSLGDFMRRTGTAAFLTLRNDTLLSEWYSPGYNRESVFSAFSLTKVFVSVLAGIAIEEGYIQSVQQPVSDFFPEYLNDTSLAKIKIIHLLQMTSGLKSHEGFSPWSAQAKMYYGSELEKFVLNAEPDDDPGKKWNYLNLNTQILGMIIMKATGKSLSQYLEEKIWIPAGMEGDVTWSLDKEGGMEKAFCCLNARPIDFAKLGVLMLNRGRIDSVSLIPQDWVRRSTMLDTSNGSPQRYQYHWYTSAEKVDFYGEGLLGQFLYVAPETGTVIVRMGDHLHVGTPWYDMFKVIAGLSIKPERTLLPKEQMEMMRGEWDFGISTFGDSVLYGKKVWIKPTRKVLKVKTSYGKRYKLFPASNALYFDMKDARRVIFFFDEKGKPVKMHWMRRGNEWDLYPAQNVESPSK